MTLGLLALGLLLFFMKLVVWNPLTLASTYRIELAATTLNADVVLVAGTGLRSPPDSKHTYWNINESFWIISFGWRKSKYVNNTAGCAIILRSSLFKPSHVTRVETPPNDLRGRGGAIRVKAPAGDFTFGVQYNPPIAGNSTQK